MIKKNNPVGWLITKSNGKEVFVRHIIIVEMIMTTLPGRNVNVDSVKELYQVNKVIPLYSEIQDEKAV